MDKKEFAEIPVWGYVNPATIVVDDKGHRYIVKPQDDGGWIVLRNLSGGKDDAFDAMDPIDHSSFSLADPTKP